MNGKTGQIYECSEAIAAATAEAGEHLVRLSRRELLLAKAMPAKAPARERIAFAKQIVKRRKQRKAKRKAERKRRGRR